MLNSTFNGGCSIFLFSLGICGVTRYELKSIFCSLHEIYKRGNRVSRILFACFPSLLAFVFEAKDWPGRLEPLGLLFLFEKGREAGFYNYLRFVIGYYWLLPFQLINDSYKRNNKNDTTPTITNDSPRAATTSSSDSRTATPPC